MLYQIVFCDMFFYLSNLTVRKRQQSQINSYSYLYQDHLNLYVYLLLQLYFRSYLLFCILIRLIKKHILVIFLRRPINKQYKPFLLDTVKKDRWINSPLFSCCTHDFLIYWKCFTRFNSSFFFFLSVWNKEANQHILFPCLLWFDSHGWFKETFSSLVWQWNTLLASRTL